MFILTDEAIESGINIISGYIVTAVASMTGKPIEDVTEAFLLSATYSLLSDKETGYYWDSMDELIDKFMAEIQNPHDTTCKILKKRK